MARFDKDPEEKQYLVVPEDIKASLKLKSKGLQKQAIQNVINLHKLVYGVDLTTESNPANFYGVVDESTKTQ
jgi:hypothetical protein